MPRVKQTASKSTGGKAPSISREMSRNARKRALSPGPRIEIKKPPLKKRKGVYFVGNFEFNTEKVTWKKSSVRRKLTSDIKTRLDKLQSLEWGTRKRLNEALRREIEKSHRDSSTGEAFDWEYKVPNSDKVLKCTGRPAKYDAKTSLVLLKIKNGEATAFPVEKTIDFKRLIEVDEEMEDAEEVEMKQKEDEKNLMKSDRGQILRRMEEKITGEIVAKNSRDEVAVSMTKIRGALKTTSDEKDMKGYDKRHLKNRTRGMRDDVGDFEESCSDDEDQPQLEDDDVLNTKEEDDGSSEEESSKDEDYKKLQGLIKDSEEGVDPMQRRKKRKKSIADDEESSDDSDMFARAQLSDVSSSDDEPEPTTGRDKLSSKREARKRARETREVVKRQAEAKKLAASLKQSTGLTKQGVSKILQRHPKGIDTKGLFNLIKIQCNEDSKELSKKLKPILKAVGKRKKVEGKTLWFLKQKKEK